MDSVTKEEYKIDSNKIPYIESLEKENSELKLKLQNLKQKDEKISELKGVIVEAKKANDSLVNQLGKFQNQQFFDRGNLTENNTYLNKLTNDLRNANIKLKSELNNKNSIINGLKNELQIKCDLLEEQQVSSVSIQDLSNLNKTIYEQKQKILNLDKTLLEKDLMIENLKSISIVKSPNVTKKIRIFGIPIYTSETK
jgi:DNA repair exonuclease SbcCD ATPase subunit